MKDVMQPIPYVCCCLLQLSRYFQLFKYSAPYQKKINFRVKNHFIAGLLFDWIGFYLTRTYFVIVYGKATEDQLVKLKTN